MNQHTPNVSAEREQCQKSDWCARINPPHNHLLTFVYRKYHKKTCIPLRDMRNAGTISAATLRLASHAPGTKVEFWLQPLTTHLLSLPTHPEHARSQAVVLSWALIPAISPREYRKGRDPRVRLNDVGERMYMLMLQNFAIREFQSLGGPEPGKDWRVALEN